MLHSMGTPAKLPLSPGLAWRDGGLGTEVARAARGPTRNSAELAPSR